MIYNWRDKVRKVAIYSANSVNKVKINKRQNCCFFRSVVFWQGFGQIPATKRQFLVLACSGFANFHGGPKKWGIPKLDGF